MKDIEFKLANRGYWFGEINRWHEYFNTISTASIVTLTINPMIKVKELTPAHIVSLACLLDLIKRKSINLILRGSDEIVIFFRDDLKIGNYFNDYVHIDSDSPNIFNLWQIKEERTLFYGLELVKFFKRHYFKGYDISILQVVLDELYENIKDHAKASGIAYSFVKYNIEKKKFDIAFCDFGIGIPKCFKNARMEAPNDCYIEYATKGGVTTRSGDHNKGYGLETLVNSSEELRIISNDELYYCNKNNNNKKTYKLNFDFKGTIIYADLNIDIFEKEEIIGRANLFNEEEW